MKIVYDLLHFCGNVAYLCRNILFQRKHTLKKFTKAGSSGTSAAFEGVDSRGPSITAIVGTASSSSNSLQFNIKGTWWPI